MHFLAKSHYRHYPGLLRRSGAEAAFKRI